MGCLFGTADPSQTETQPDAPSELAQTAAQKSNDSPNKPQIATITIGGADEPEIEPFEEGVKVVTISDGDGKNFPKKGDELTMHYVGTFHGGYQHDEKFDSSRDNGKPFKFQIGTGRVIKGWDEGVMQMSVGQKAHLQISWHYGYGERGMDGVIPPEQDLLFEVELLKIN